MKLRPLFVAFALCVSLPLAAAPASPTSPANAAEPWKAVAATGAVEAFLRLSDGSEWHRVTRGDELMPRTQVRTGKNGRTTLAQKAQIVVVQPGSELELPATGATPEMAEVQQSSGSVVYKIRKEEKAHFRVRTPHLVAVVKGTAFLVEVENGRSWVTVDRGMVEVIDQVTGDSVDVRAGESVVFDPEIDGALERVDGEADRRNRKHAARHARQLERELDDLETTEDETLEGELRPTGELDTAKGDDPNEGRTAVELEVVYDETEREKEPIDPGSTDPGGDPGTIEPFPIDPLDPLIPTEPDTRIRELPDGIQTPEQPPST